MLKIVQVPNDILTSPSTPVKNINDSILKLVEEMKITLNALTELIGVGLAAPQVGSDLSLFIMKPTRRSEVNTFINPKIITLSPIPLKKKTPSKKKKKSSRFEGCLSIPKIWSPIKRSSKALIEYQTLEGIWKKEWFSGFRAVIVQHEIDHLNGVLFTQRALEQKTPLYEEKDGKLKKLQLHP